MYKPRIRYFPSHIYSHIKHRNTVLYNIFYSAKTNREVFCCIPVLDDRTEDFLSLPLSSRKKAVYFLAVFSDG